MKTVTFYFSECEHNGDLQNYKDDITKSGGQILQSYVDHKEEEGVVEVIISPSFWDSFRKTNAYQFCESR